MKNPISKEYVPVAPRCQTLLRIPLDSPVKIFDSSAFSYNPINVTFARKVRRKKHICKKVPYPAMLGQAIVAIALLIACFTIVQCPKKRLPFEAKR